MPRVAVANRSALVPQNFFLRSEALSNAAWSKVRCNVADTTADLTAPDGTNTATKWTEDASAASTHFFQSAANPVVIRDGECGQIVFWLKGGAPLATTRRVYIQFNDGTGLSFALFNPRTGLIDAVGTSDRTFAKMTAEANGWFRCTAVTKIIPSGQESNAMIVFFELDNGANGAGVSNVYNGDGAAGVYIAWLSCNLSGPDSGPVEYVKTLGAAVIGNPRFRV